ncbi:MAG: hypothetical protein J7M14_02145 [Planctomycetes bacterium]|nr:hypothetical protein [Planctomycetota bacterium]
MRRICMLLIVCVGLSSAMVGCGAGVADDSSARWRRYRQIVDLQRRQAADDWDYITLMDRGSSLSQWKTFIGH